MVLMRRKGKTWGTMGALMTIMSTLDHMSRKFDLYEGESAKNSDNLSKGLEQSLELTSPQPNTQQKSVNIPTAIATRAKSAATPAKAAATPEAKVAATADKDAALDSIIVSPSKGAKDAKAGKEGGRMGNPKQKDDEAVLTKKEAAAKKREEAALKRKEATEKKKTTC
ncbi:hypothetical protein DY000_02021773 [Brassica cretica]|uniref:Uncharacterized protein n=1 Tax=Brassica cretica TaxID=69181 RepID=A0ABQ7EES0_BRACR|nr:hypothetical protein DY000_02021773 [Brassica cretica]